MEKLLKVKIGDLVTDPAYQPREELNAEHVESIAISMRKSGFKFDDALTVEPREDGKFTVVKGHHRLAGAESAGIQEIWVFAKEYENALERIADATISNLGLAMKPMETVHVASRMLEQGADIETVAGWLGKTVKSIQMDLPLAELPGIVKKKINNGEMSKVVARYIAESVIEDGIDPIKATEKAGNAGGNANRQIAAVNVYREQVFQSRNNRLLGQVEAMKKEAEKTPANVICQYKDKDFTFKNARKSFDSLVKSVTTYSESPLGNGYSDKLFLAKKGCHKMVPTIVEKLRTIATKLEKDSAEYEARMAPQRQVVNG